MSYGDPLTEVEQNQLDSLDLSDLVYLSSGELIKPDIFRVGKNNVIRVIFSFKNTDVYVLEPDFITKSKKKTDNNKTLDNLKNQETKFELFFVVVQNKQQITSNELLEIFYQKFFDQGMRELMPKSVVLEAIQFQVIYPLKNKGNLTQLSMPSTGSYFPEGDSRGGVSLKPFILSLVPVIGGGGKNAFKLLFPFLTEDLKNPEIFEKYKIKLDRLKENLVLPMVIGESGDLVLKLVVKTTRSINKRPFIPVQTASWAGFTANSRIRNAKSLVLTSNPENLLIDSESSGSFSTSPPEQFIEAEVVEKETKSAKKNKKQQWQRVQCFPLVLVAVVLHYLVTLQLTTNYLTQTILNSLSIL